MIMKGVFCKTSFSGKNRQIRRSKKNTTLGRNCLAQQEKEKKGGALGVAHIGLRPSWEGSPREDAVEQANGVGHVHWACGLHPRRSRKQGRSTLGRASELPLFVTEGHK